MADLKILEPKELTYGLQSFNTDKQSIETTLLTFNRPYWDGELFPRGCLGIVSKSIPLLDNFEPDKPKGIIKDIVLGQDSITCTVSFPSTPNYYFNDLLKLAESGIFMYLAIGYTINSYKMHNGFKLVNDLTIHAAHFSAIPAEEIA